jgi:competence protein ComEC
VDTAQNASATSDSSAVTELTHYDANSSVTNNSSQYDNPPDISYIDDAPTATEFIVYFLDVGQAAAAFIYSDGETMLIDGGGASSSNLIYSFLDRHGIDHLDYIINTHPHEDHVGGLSGALNRVSSVGVALGSATAYDTRAFNSFLSNLDNHGVELTIPKAGNSFMLGTATVEILAHLRDYNDVNNNSIVIKITYGETRFLFLGDAERASELDMVEAGLNLSATVLKVGHHGSDTSTIYPFLREVMPEIAVISCGSDNRYGHPHDNVLSRLRDASVKVYRTDLQGDIIIRSDGFNLSVETQRNANIPTNPTALPVDDYSYIGNINSKRFHRLDCRTLPAEHNRVHLESREHAIENGFDPCGNCKP